MLVLAVHVGGNHPAESDELRAWGDRREVAARHQETVELAQRETRLRTEQTRVLVEAQDAVGERRVEHVGLVVGR